MASNNSTTFKRITSQEARERWERGLCYYCDEWFVPGHLCQRAQRFIMEDVNADEEESPDGRLEHQEEEVIPEISFHAIAGTKHPQTMRLQERFKGKEVTVLVDSGSTHNFVDQPLVKKWGLKVTQDHTFQLMVATKEKIDCMRRCLALPLDIQGYQMKADFDVLPVATCPLVL